METNSAHFISHTWVSATTKASQQAKHTPDIQKNKKYTQLLILIINTQV